MALFFVAVLPVCVPAVCAMMSTADSALLAFSSMWVKDLFVPYLRPKATQAQQIWFGRLMSVIGLSIGVALGGCCTVAVVGCQVSRVERKPAMTGSMWATLTHPCRRHGMHYVSPSAG